MTKIFQALPLRCNFRAQKLIPRDEGETWFEAMFNVATNLTDDVIGVSFHDVMHIALRYVQIYVGRRG